MTDDELFDKAEECLYMAISTNDIWFSLIENGYSEDDAHRIQALVDQANVSVSWNDNVQP